jgi:hypothetical protein
MTRKEKKKKTTDFLQIKNMNMFWVSFTHSLGLQSSSFDICFLASYSLENNLSPKIVELDSEGGGFAFPGTKGNGPEKPELDRRDCVDATELRVCSKGGKGRKITVIFFV